MNKDNKKEHQNNKIIIENGNGKNLKISTVYDHTKSSTSTNKDEEKKEIVIPKSSSDKDTY